MKRGNRPTTLFSFIILLGLFTHQTSAWAITKPKSPQRTKTLSAPSVLDWLAFGSSCNASKSKPQVDVEFQSQFEQALISTFKFKSLQLLMDQKDKGLAECALRVSVQPPAKMRIANVVARTQLVAYKDELTHLRARLLLLVGETMVSQRTWDLQPNEFAKNREHDVVLYSGENTAAAHSNNNCEKPQIIGLDYTFEGVHKSNPPSVLKPERNKSDSSWIKAGRLPNENTARIEVYFEQC